MFLKHPVADANLAPVGGYARRPVFLKNLHTLVDLLNDDLFGFLECFLVFCGPSEWLQQVPEGSHHSGAGKGVCHLIYQAKPRANISGRGGGGELSNSFLKLPGWLDGGHADLETSELHCVLCELKFVRVEGDTIGATSEDSVVECLLYVRRPYQSVVDALFVMSSTRWQCTQPCTPMGRAVR